MRWFKGAAALAAVCLLAGCGAAPAGVEDLLRAPQLDGQQNEVEKALIAYLGETPQMKYPTTGENLSPFVFDDWDGDGDTDAAALYVSTAKGQNVHLAVLETVNGEWAVTQEREGLATSVESIETASLRGAEGTQLLVGYAAASGEKYLAVYSYQSETLNEVFHQPYSQYELRDISGSGGNDLVIIGPESGSGLQLQMLTAQDGQFIPVMPPLAVGNQFTSCEGLYTSKGDDGSYYLILDGQTGNANSLASMILYYDARQQQLVTYHPITVDDLFAATQRYSSLLKSQDIDSDGTVEIPTQLDGAGMENLAVNRLSFVAWMDYTTEYEQVKSFGVADLEYGYYLELPGEWQGQIMLTDGDEPDSWQVRTAGGEDLLLTVRVVSPNASQGGGYFLLGNLGAQKVQARLGTAEPQAQSGDLIRGFRLL